MARSTRPPRKALWAITATVAVVALTAVPAWAQPFSPAAGRQVGAAAGRQVGAAAGRQVGAAAGRQVGAAAGRPGGAAACQASDLRISVPTAIAGDPARGMGKQAWNLLFRNTADTSCSLRGWPRITVRNRAGKTVATKVTDAQSSNLAVVPDARIVLRPGQAAVVTAVSAISGSRCVIRWTLALRLPGAERPVSVGATASSFAPCVGGRLRLSPFYSEKTLTREIRALSVSAVPPPFTVSTAAEPSACPTADLRARVISTSSQADGSIVEVRLVNTGPTCVLATTWPTVQVHLTGNKNQVAKIFATTAALRAERVLLTTYEHGMKQRTALTLRRGGSVTIAVLAPRSGKPAGAKKPGPACQRVTSITIYPSDVARGAGRRAALTAPVSICAAPRILSFLPGGTGGATMTIARGARRAIRGAPAKGAPSNDSPGFFYGTDSSAPAACGNGPYTEPVNGDCSSTDGPYGEYMGELGSYENWQGCTTSGLAWVQGNYNMANDNIMEYGVGIGAAGYWFAAGPGRDPHYNGTTSEAMAWGQEQAQQAMSQVSTLFFNFRYIFMDIENNGTPPDEYGWNTVWNGPCGNNVQAEYVAPNVDYATFLGFANYINDNSPYTAGVYSAGGQGYGSWTGIFGSEKIPGGAAEWTFTTEQSQLNFPAGFTGSAASPNWFANAPAACDLVWQWSGGDGVLNSYGDFDQVEAANNINPSC